jgi:hypothetical protein
MLETGYELRRSLLFPMQCSGMLVTEPLQL